MFVPVSSALALRDISSLRQVTVMNDRPQLATAEYHNATVEFVHLAQFGRVITGQYWLQIFDRWKGESKQRDQQILAQKSPLQYAFAFNLENSRLHEIINNKQLKLKKQRSVFDIGQAISTSKLDIQVEPVHPNELLVQVTNLADRFDDRKEIGVSQIVALGQKAAVSSKQARSGSFDTKYVNVQQLANALYFSATNSTKLPKLKITEVPLSGIEKADKNETRMSWDQQPQGNREERAVYPLFLNPADRKGLSGVALQP